MTRIICNICGAVCVPQSEEMMNGSDNLFACPNGHTNGIYEDKNGRVYQNYWPIDGQIIKEA